MGLSDPGLIQLQYLKDAHEQTYSTVRVVPCFQLIFLRRNLLAQCVLTGIHGRAGPSPALLGHLTLVYDILFFYT